MMFAHQARLVHVITVRLIVTLFRDIDNWKPNTFQSRPQNNVPIEDDIHYLSKLGLPYFWSSLPLLCCPTPAYRSIFFHFVFEMRHLLFFYLVLSNRHYHSSEWWRILFDRFHGRRFLVVQHLWGNHIYQCLVRFDLLEKKIHRYV